MLIGIWASSAFYKVFRNYYFVYLVQQALEYNQSELTKEVYKLVTNMA